MPQPGFEAYRPPRAAIGETAGVAPEPLTGNPWLTIWIRPRATIRQVLDSGGFPGISLLPFFLGVASSLEQTLREGRSEELWEGQAIPKAVGGGIGGLFLLIVAGLLIRLTGRWLGGKASQKDLRVAMSWSLVPFLAVILLYFLAVPLCGPVLLDPGSLRGQPRATIYVFLVLTILRSVAALWSMVLWVSCVAEAHRFSWVKAIGAGFLAYLVCIAAILAIAGVAYLLGLPFPK